MPRSGILGNPQPYTPFGVFAGLPFWGGGLTLLAAAPGIGKTSWLLRMIFESACIHIPSAIGCYKNTPEELRFRLFLQTEAMTGGPHTQASQSIVESALARASEAFLLSLNSREDTVRALEDMLIHDYAFPVKITCLSVTTPKVMFNYVHPCPYGFWNHQGDCECGPAVVPKFQKRISGRILDRIDINMENQRVQEDLNFRPSDYLLLGIVFILVCQKVTDLCRCSEPHFAATWLLFTFLWIHFRGFPKPWTIIAGLVPLSKRFKNFSSPV
jgi:hypothetical protein